MAFDYSRLRATCAVESPDKAITLPTEAYGSDDLYAAEVDRIFKRGWIPLCRVEQVPTPGTYYSIDILGTPLVVTRDRHSEIRVLSRNCTHRWMEVCSGAGQANVLQCPYHLWSFGLDGHLAGAPEMKMSPGFDRNAYPLKKFRHEVWKGFVMVNFDGHAESLASRYAALDHIMVDNFMECYHHMGPHRGSLEDRFPAALSYTGEVGDYFTTMWSQQKQGYPADPPFLTPGADTLTDLHRDRSLIFIAYPLLQIAMGPAYMYWLKTLPLGAGKIELQLDICMSPASLVAPNVEERRSELVKLICDIHREDLDVCGAVQRAIRSGVTSTGRLSHLERPLWEFYRYLGRELGLINSTTTLASAG